ncbi:type II/III secretion system family protein [Burkholderia stagnalis]|nr:type II/III secretion system family protein [Burkholderia stagnalis]
MPSGDGDARSLDAQRNGFAMRITPHETAQAGRYALDLRIVERWASGGAPSRDTVSDVTLSAGECAALALPPADGRGEQRLVLVTPRVAPPPASPVARAPDTAKPAPRTHAPSRAHPAAGLGLSTQTRLLGN